MQPTSLLTLPWLPVLIDGKIKEVGLQALFEQADTITQLIADPMTLWVLRRFVIAIVFDSHQDLDEIEALDMKRLLDYLTTHADAFTVEHFMQAEADEPTDTVNRLIPHLSSKSTTLLFDHTRDADDLALAPAEAIRYLLLNVSLNVAGGRGFKPSYTCGRTGVWMLGQNLGESLLLNAQFTPKDGAWGQPIWRSGLPIENKEIVPEGLLAYLTLPARAIKLFIDTDGLIRQIAFQQGLKLSKPKVREAFEHIDPLLSPIYGQETRTLWHDAHTLLASADRPQSIEAAIRFIRKNKHPRLYIDVFTHVPTNGGTLTARTERIPFYPNALRDVKLKKHIVDLGTHLREGEKAINRACATFARALGAKADIGNGYSVPATALYWSQVPEIGLRALAAIRQGAYSTPDILPLARRLVEAALPMGARYARARQEALRIFDIPPTGMRVTSPSGMIKYIIETSDRALLARLRRAYMSDGYSQVYGNLRPYLSGLWEEECEQAVRIATLIAHHRGHSTVVPRQKGYRSLGATLKDVRNEQNNTALDRRFEQFLAARSPHEAFRYAGLLVALVGKTPIDYHRLYSDLALWDDAVRERLAFEYYT